jgi:hypothetical protein
MKYLQARMLAKKIRPVVDPFAGLEELLNNLEGAYMKYGFENQDLSKKDHIVGILLDRTFGELKFSLDGKMTDIVITDEKLKTAELKLYLKV